jgi:hypothetical protein
VVKLEKSKLEEKAREMQNHPFIKALTQFYPVKIIPNGNGILVEIIIKAQNGPLEIIRFDADERGYVPVNHAIFHAVLPSYTISNEEGQAEIVKRIARAFMWIKA